MSGERSLKSLNMKWLVLLAFADVLAVLFFIAPELTDGKSLKQLGIARLLTTTVIPVVVLLLVNVLPHNVKAMLVYWRRLGVMPASEAFTKYAPDDPRIDLVALKKNVGAFPTEPKEQNAKWYKLYKQVQNEPNVAEAHKLFLMYRDMAIMSLIWAALVPIALLIVGTQSFAPKLAIALFIFQYFVTAISARWSGLRFVSNVLAVHSTRKVTAPITRTVK